MKMGKGFESVMDIKVCLELRVALVFVRFYIS
jgi:hypothetical protein